MSIAAGRERAQSTHPCDLVLEFLPVDALPAPAGTRRVTPLRRETAHQLTSAIALLMGLSR